jgi:hypothetical protein
LPEVDQGRIGVCGESGGGLQTQMLVALDRRVKAATVVGMTSPLREILFPYNAHCGCNHFPGIMRYTDMPELSLRPSLVVEDAEDLELHAWAAAMASKVSPVIHFRNVRNALIHACRCPEAAAKFLRVDGAASERIKLIANDWAATQGVELRDGASEKAVTIR